MMHRRLSILDLSEQGHQPMSTSCQRFVIVYNGEVYNYKELREELRNKGYAFKSDSDTEVILNGYKEWGKLCFSRLNGMWAIAIFDKQKNELILSRDRFGIKPLYYYVDEEYLVFASEIKAFYCYEKATPKLDEKEVINYIFHGTTSKEYASLYSNVIDVQPSATLTYSITNGTLHIEKYYQLEQQIGRNYQEDILQEGKDLIQQVISSHMQSDVEVGTCLSGGLDSSLITWFAAHHLKGENIKTFTASYPGFKHDETSYAKSVANSIHNVKDFYTTPTSNGLLNDIDKIIYHQDLPIGSSTIYAQWEVMRLASENKIKVLLDGQGADEVLGGYAAFGGHYLLQLLQDFRFLRFFRDYSSLKKKFSSSISNQLFRAGSYRLPIGMQDRIRKKQRISGSILNDDAYSSLVNENNTNRGGANFMEHSLKSTQYGMYDLLRYEDRNAMAFSIESRVPFLDHKLVEFLINLPIDYKFNNGWSKFVFRKTLQEKLPDQVVWRKYKKGFITPQEEWKEAIGNYFLEYFQVCSLPSYINRNALIKLCENLGQNANHLTEFWRIFSVIKWLEGRVK